MRNGFMLPNTEWSAWTNQDVLAIYDLEPSVILVPVYGADNPFQTDRNHFIQQLAMNLPNCKFLFRMMAENAVTFNAVSWGLECRQRYYAIGVTGDVIPLNEPNIEGGGENWDALVNWLIDFQQASGLNNLHVPALSPVGNYKQSWAKLGTLHSTYKAFDIHIYPDNTNDIAECKQYFIGPLWITEYNRLMPTAIAASAQGTAEGIIWFILRGTQDQQQYNLVEPYYSDVKKVNVLFPVTAPIGPPGPVSPLRSYLTFPDISNNNGDIVPMDVIARLYSAVAMKATEGLHFIDQDFADSWARAGDLGLVRIAYHFARPSQGSGHDEANFFLSTAAKDLRSGDIFALDSEDDQVANDADLAAHHIDFYNVADAAWGALGWLYSRVGYMNDHKLINNATLSQHGLWLAQLGENKVVTLPAGWTVWAVHQYGQSIVPGFLSAADVNRFNGTLTQLKLYGRP